MIKIKRKLIDLNFDTFYRNLAIRKINKVFNFKNKNILFLNGADAIINFLIVNLCRDRKVLYFSKNYRYATKLIKKVSCDYLEFFEEVESNGVNRINFDKLIRNFDIIYITNPDNRFGFIFRKKEILRLIGKNKDKIFIIDESYSDYFSENSLIDAVDDFDNLIIIKTLSKIFMFELERMAFFVMSKKLLDDLIDIIPQYPLSFLTIKTFFDKKFLDINVLSEMSKIRKDNFIKVLKQRKVRFVYSYTNFITINKKDWGLIKDLKIKSKKEFLYKGEEYLRISI